MTLPERLGVGPVEKGMRSDCRDSNTSGSASSNSIISSVSSSSRSGVCHRVSSSRGSAAEVVGVLEPSRIEGNL